MCSKWARLAAVFVLAGCAAAGGSAPETKSLVIPGVPRFEEQVRRDDCAGVALASLLGQAGVNVSPAAIDAVVYEPRLGGALLPDLEAFAVKAGANPHSGRGTVADLRQLLAAGHPVLVPLDMGWGWWRRPHYVVIYGFGPEHLLIHVRHDDTREMSDEEFDRRWGGMGRLYLYLNLER